MYMDGVDGVDEKRMKSEWENNEGVITYYSNVIRESRSPRGK